ncbi:hypothetical protein [Bosea sp. UC22_33]|uniref:hypothetical protein n=1 Tax=Bosea sp. UC22_33 TaxID=3350165 RepID=UPI00366DB440
MADPNIEALQQRIATLEAQVAALVQAISADRSGNVVINARGSLTVLSGSGMELYAGSAMTMTSGNVMTMTAGNNLSVNASNHATLVVGNRLRVSGHEASFETRSLSISAAVGCDIDSGQNFAITAGKSMAMSVGEDMSVRVGKTLAVESADAATLKSGDARLNLKKDGSVELQGARHHAQSFRTPRGQGVRQCHDQGIEGAAELSVRSGARAPLPATPRSACRRAR